MTQTNKFSIDGLTPQRSANRTMDGMVRMAPRRLNPAVNASSATILRPSTSQPKTSMTVRRMAPTQVPAQPRVTRSTVLKRQSVRPPAGNERLIWTQPSDIAANKKRRKFRLFLSSMTLLLFSMGLWLSFNTWRLSHTAKAEASALATQTQKAADTEDSVPSETPPTGSLDDYKVAETAPRLISVSRLRITGRVEPVDITSSGFLKRPTNIQHAGWYSRSAKPGLPGVVVMNGYSQGPTRAGIFYNLKKLVTGDKIEITTGDGSTTIYKVVTTQSYPKDEIDTNKLLTPVTATKNGLNIVTYDGKPTVQNAAYERRLVVFAEQSD